MPWILSMPSGYQVSYLHTPSYSKLTTSQWQAVPFLGRSIVWKIEACLPAMHSHLIPHTLRLPLFRVQCPEGTPRLVFCFLEWPCRQAPEVPKEFRARKSTSLGVGRSGFESNPLVVCEKFAPLLPASVSPSLKGGV